MNGGATAWLLPFVDGAPPIGWEAATPYLVLPVLLLVAQYASNVIISPVDPNQENAAQQQLIIYLLPLTIVWFSLTVPSGLSLYYFSNTVITSAQQVRPPEFSLPWQCALSPSPRFVFVSVSSLVHVAAASVVS